MSCPSETGLGARKRGKEQDCKNNDTVLDHKCGAVEKPKGLWLLSMYTTNSSSYLWSTYYMWGTGLSPLPA